jgi:thiosulfate/3-mercaptopyruvate sulfurtransferase
MPTPIRERGYPYPELLAETDWLASRLSDPTVRVVDARLKKDYAAGHIPGAVLISGFTLGGIRPEPEMPEPEAFAHLVGALGIDERTPVVVYDAGGRSQMAGMTAWTFLYYGHPDVRYLDGGLAKWTAEGLPLSSDAPAHEPRTFAARLAEGVYCSLDQAKASVDDDGVVFWDVRELGEFDGTTKGWSPPPRLGHLPGAIQLNYTELFDADDGTLKPAAELTTLLGARGITPEAKIVPY